MANEWCRFLDIHLTRLLAGKHTEPEYFKDIFEVSAYLTLSHHLTHTNVSRTAWH